MLCQSPFKIASSNSERPSELVPVNNVTISALVRISAIKDVHQVQETKSQVVVEPRLVRERSKREKALVRISRGEHTFPSFLDLKGCSSCAERAQELLASLLHVPSEISHIALLSLAQLRKPFVLQTVASAVLKIDDFDEEEQTIGEEDVVTIVQDKAVEFVVSHVIICTRF
jgi:hypothetical protein